MTVQVIHGDSREVLPRLQLDPERTVVLTDPPWPGADVDIQGGGVEAEPLWEQVAPLLPRIATRLVLHLSSLTDPRGMVSAVPPSLTFVSAVWMRFVPASYRGFVMANDIAYVFGAVRMPPGVKMLPGMLTGVIRKDRWIGGHPCPRNLDHVRQLLRWYAAKATTIVDPFCGSGTTLVAAAELGLSAIGIECDARWIAEARERVRMAEAQQLLGGVA